MPPTGDQPTLTPAPAPATPGATFTPDLALQRDELGRARVFARLVVLCAPPVALGFLSLPAGGLARWVPVVGCLTLAVVFGVFLFSLRRAESFTPLRALGMAFLALLLGGMPCVVAVGVFSAGAMAVVPGLYFFALAGHARGALLLYLAVALLYLVPALLFAGGVLPDPGIVTVRHLSRGTQLILVALEQITLLATYLLARRSREVTKGVVERLHDALLGVQRREALLAEARLDLDRALGPEARGPYSGRTVGPYTLGRVIGRGAMGDVYRAVGAEEPAAVKLLHVDLLDDPGHLRRFFREAEIASALRSPHVVRVLSVGATDAAALRRGELPYIAMELLQGHDLAWHLRRKPRLSLEVVVEMVAQVARGLEAAAAAGVVHRDLKPQNIFGVEDDGQTVWKVLDFGVSKLTEGRGTLTQGEVVGTPAYMAPEQAGADEVGTAADVFALTAIAYRGLTGRPAFSGQTTPKILYEVCYRQPPRPVLFADLAADVERVLALGLAKRAQDRLASARELGEAMTAAAAGALPPELVRRADRLLLSAPWGATVTPT